MPTYSKKCRPIRKNADLLHFQNADLLDIKNADLFDEQKCWPTRISMDEGARGRVAPEAPE